MAPEVTLVAEYEAHLVGPNARLGEVAAVDVARLILGVQAVVARAAAASTGRPAKATGRWESSIEAATRLRLREVRPGSVAVAFDLPSSTNPDDMLDLATESIGEAGWSAVARAVDVPDEAATDVLRRLVRVADEVGVGTRFEAIHLVVRGTVLTRVDVARRDHLREVVAQRDAVLSQPSAVTGILFEADFENRSAKVRAQSGDVVALEFEDDQADAIHDALRATSDFEGEVTYDPVTNGVRSVHLRQVRRVEQLVFEGGTESFWEPLSLDRLAADQDVTPSTSFEGLVDDTLTDEEFDAFLAALS